MAPPNAPTYADKTCDNPCKTLPYKPENAVEEGALDTWFRLKNDEWHPNPGQRTDVKQVVKCSFCKLPGLSKERYQ